MVFAAASRAEDARWLTEPGQYIANVAGKWAAGSAQRGVAGQLEQGTTPFLESAAT